MNLYRSPYILRSTAVVVLINLNLQAKPLLAHSEHYDKNNQKEQIQPQKQQSKQHNQMHSEIEEKSQSQSSPSAEINPLKEVSKGTSIANESIPISFIPQPGELLLFLLIASPFLLYLLKNRMYHNK